MNNINLKFILIKYNFIIYLFIYKKIDINIHKIENTLISISKYIPIYSNISKYHEKRKKNRYDGYI
jgi:hypothetical protein